MQVRDLRAQVDHASDKLMPEHDSRAAENWAVIPLGGVRPADRRANHLQHDLAPSSWGGFRDILDADVVRAVEDRRPHELSTRSGP